MQHVLFKKLKLSLLMAQVALVMGTNLAEAAPRCSVRTIVTRATEATAPTPIYLSKISGVSEIRLKAATLKKLQEIFEKKDWELTTKNIKEVIEGAAELINGTTNTPSVERSNEMAKIGREILKTVKGDLTESDYKAVNYLIAEAVLRLETYRMSEFKTDPSLEPKVFKKNIQFTLQIFTKWWSLTLMERASIRNCRKMVMVY